MNEGAANFIPVMKLWRSERNRWGLKKRDSKISQEELFYVDEFYTLRWWIWVYVKKSLTCFLYKFI